MPRHNVTGELEQDAILAFRRVLSPGGAAGRMHTGRKQIYRMIDDGRLLAWFFPGRRKPLTGLSLWLAGGDREYGQGELYVDFGVDDGQVPADWRVAATEWQGVLAGPKRPRQPPLGFDPDYLVEQAVERFHVWRRAHLTEFVEEFGDRSYARLLIDRESTASDESAASPTLRLGRG